MEGADFSEQLTHKVDVVRKQNDVGLASARSLQSFFKKYAVLADRFTEGVRSAVEAEKMKIMGQQDRDQMTSCNNAVSSLLDKMWEVATMTAELGKAINGEVLGPLATLESTTVSTLKEVDQQNKHAQAGFKYAKDLIVKEKVRILEQNPAYTNERATPLFFVKI